MKRHLLFLPLILLFISLTAMGQAPTQVIRGRVFDKQTQSPLIGATIKLTEGNRGSVTDEEGYFRIEGVPVGRISLSVSYLGYEPILLSNLSLSSGKEMVLEIEMEEKVLEAQEVVITADQDKINTNNDMATVSARQFTIEEAERFAGARNDPARMASNFAGVQGTNDAVNDIVVRGNTPYELLWRLEGVDIPNPNHFGDFGATGGPVSALNTNLLANSDFFTGAFPADYGNAISGVFDLRMRNGNDEKHEFLGQIGFNGLEFGAEGPISKKNHFSYLASYRYSTLSIFNALGINFGTGTAIPYYQDFSFKLNFPSDHVGRITVFGLLSEDHLDLKADDLGDENLYISRRIDYSGQNKAAVAGISHTYLTGKNSYTKLTLAYTYGFNRDDVDSLSVVNDAPHDFYNADQSEQKMFASFLYNLKLSHKNLMRAGMYGSRSWFAVADSVYRSSRDEFQVISSFDGGITLLQPYINWQYRPNDQLTFNGGIHTMILPYNQSVSFEPRLGVKYELTEKQQLSFGYGWHTFMAPAINYFRTAETEEGLLVYPNTDLGFVQSQQFVLGYDYNFSRILRLKIESYYQYLYDVVAEQSASSYSIVNQGGLATDATPDSLNNSGTGRNYGAELTFEKFLDKGFYFLITASVFDSKYKGSDGVLRNTAWNSHFITNYLAGKDFALNKNKSDARRRTELTADLKVTWAGGRWYTPVDVEQSLISGETKYMDELAFTERFPDYFRLDARIGFRMHGKQITQEWALDVQNVTNRKNPLYQRVDLSTGDVQTINQLGVFPVLQYRIQF